MLLSPPDSPSLAAALLGTTDGEELVATDVGVDVVVEASEVLAGDVLTTLTVAVVVPEERVVVPFRVQETVEIEVGVVMVVVVVVPVSFDAEETAAPRAARMKEERILTV